MEDPDNSCISIWVIIACRREDHDVGFRPGVETILRLANVVGSVIYSECLVLIDASANDLEGGLIVVSEVGVCRIVQFISEAGQEMVLQFGVKILWRCMVRR